MSTRFSCVKCGCIIAIDDKNLSVINDEIFCPNCNHWSKYIATTTPDDVQEVDVVVVDNVETDNHSDHYQSMPIEPFEVMEQRVKKHPGGESIHGMMEGKYPSAPEKLALALALKHIMRAGLKDGQPWRKDIEKAQNYLNRALTGKWLGDSDGDVK